MKTLSLLFLSLALIFLTSCSEARAKKNRISNLDQLNSPEYIIGLPQGAAAMTAGEKKFPKAVKKYYNRLSDAYAAVQYGKLDAFIFDTHNLEYVVMANPDLAIYPDMIADEHIVVGAPFSNRELMNEVDSFIAQYRKDGTYDQMYKRWFKSKDHIMPEIEPTKQPKRKLKIATEGMNEPMNHFGLDGKITGFDVEFIKRMCASLGYDYDIQIMGFDAIIPALASGKIDLAVANLNGTEERAKSMLLSKEYVDAKIGALILKNRLPEKIETSSGSDSVLSFKGKKVASITGTVFDRLINSVIPDVTHLYFNDYSSMIEALRAGKVDAIGIDQPIGRMLTGKNPDMMVFPQLVLDDQLGFAFRKGDKLAKEAEKVIDDLRKNGTLADMAERWCSGNDELMVIPKDVEERNNSPKLQGVLRFAHDDVTMPMSYCGQGKSLGFDVELAMRIGSALNRKVVLMPMSFGALLGALQSGKADMVGGCMSVTDERKKSVDFAGSYYRSGIALLVKKPKSSAPKTEISVLRDLSGKTVGVTSGTKFDLLLKEKIPDANPDYFTSYPDQLLALRSGKIAAFVLDEPLARMLRAKQPGLQILSEPLTNDSYAFMFSKSRESLRDDFNRILKEMRDSGIIKEMDKRWFSANESVRIIPDYPLEGNNGTLTMAADTSSDPFTYLKEGRMIGFEIDIATYIAAKLGYRLKFINPSLETLIAAVVSGKADFAGCCISVTEERKKSVLFSNSHYDGGVVLLSLERNAGLKSTGEEDAFFSSFCESFKKTFLVEKRYMMILEGLWITVLITIFSAILGTFLGFGICMMRRSTHALASIPAKIYICALQGTPILVSLMILYYIVFGSVNVNAVFVAVLGFSLNFAAYVSEMMRAGIESVDKGQLEAASALGFNRFKTFWKITFPQAAKYVIPVYKGEFISMLKMTSIVGYIAIQDLTKMSDIIRSRTYEAFFPLLATAAIYFSLAYILTVALSYLESEIDPKRRKRIVKGVVTK